MVKVFKKFDGVEAPFQERLKTVSGKQSSLDITGTTASAPSSSDYGVLTISNSSGGDSTLTLVPPKDPLARLVIKSDNLANKVEIVVNNVDDTDNAVIIQSFGITKVEFRAGIGSQHWLLQAGPDLFWYSVATNAHFIT